MLDAELGQRPADLGGVPAVDPAAGDRGVEVVAAAVGVERTEQALLGDHLGQRPEARGGALLRDQERRVDLARRVVERDHEVERRRGPASQACRAASWCSSIPGSGRRGRLRRCAPRRGARFTCPEACSASRVTV